MTGMPAAHDPSLAAEYVLGSLEGDERARFEAHLREGCDECAREVDAQQRVLTAATPAGPRPSPELRERVLVMAEAPRLPIDLAAYAWDEPVPGVKMATLREDPARGLRLVLAWGKPGARVPRHRHLGDEDILVLQGALRDHRAVYRAGDICRSRTGSIHTEEVMPGEDCVCFVAYYGAHEVLE